MEEQIKNILDELNSFHKKHAQEKRENFQKLLDEHYDDVVACSPSLCENPKYLKRVKSEDYCPNTDGPFEEALLCVMALKASKMFTDKKHTLENVKRIGGGFYGDGISDGISFKFDGRCYEFSNGRKQYTKHKKLPITEKHLKVIQEINKSCNNSYDFENVKVQSDQRTK